MSDTNPHSHRNKPVRNPKDPKLQKGKVTTYATEMDLWNFDDDQPQEVVTLAVDPKPTTTAEKPKAQEEELPAEEDVPFAELEQPTSSVQVVTIDPRPTPAPVDEAPKDQEEAVTALRVRPLEPGLTEEEIWDDFIDDAPAAVEQVEEKLPTATKPQSKTAATVAPKTEKPAEIAEVAPESPKEEEDTPAPVSESATPAATASSATIQITKFSKMEIYSSFAFLLLLVIGGFVAMHIFNKNTAGIVDPYAQPKLPAVGTIAKVNQAETYWRAPITEGPQRDPVKLNVTQIPCVDITLGESKASQGVLRVMFYDDKGNAVGDTVTRVFQNQVFADNQSATISFSCSAGFSDFGEQEAYRARIGKPWTVKVYEGPADNAPSESFSLLFTSPISIDRR